MLCSVGQCVVSEEQSDVLANESGETEMLVTIEAIESPRP